MSARRPSRRAARASTSAVDPAASPEIVRSCPTVDAETSRSLATFVSTGDSAIKPDWLAKSVRKSATLTADVSGTLPVTSGGTGLATISQGDLLYGSASNTLSVLAKNATASRYLSNTGTSNNPAWAQVDLSNGVTGRLPYANLTAATAASTLLGRGSSSAGDWQEITLGTGLTMTGTTLAASGGGSQTTAGNGGAQ